MTLYRLALALTLPAAILLAAPPSRAQTLPAAAAVSPAEAARQLFGFAERSFPTLLPAGASTQALANFAYRHYPATGLYLGVVLETAGAYAQGGVYVQGGSFGNTPSPVGRVADYLSPTPAIKTLALWARDLAADPTRDLYYAIQQDAASARWSRVATVDAFTGAVSSSEPLDLNLEVLAVAADGASIYLGGTTTAGTGELQRRSLPGLQLIGRMALRHASWKPVGLAASPADAGTVAIASAIAGAPDRPYIEIVRNLTLQPAITASLYRPQLVFSADGTQLYGIETGLSTAQVYRMPVGATGAGQPQEVTRVNAGRHLTLLDRVGDEILTMGKRIRANDGALLGDTVVGGCRGLGGNALLCLSGNPGGLFRTELQASGASFNLALPQGVSMSSAYRMVAARRASVAIAFEDRFSAGTKPQLLLITDDMLRP